MPRGRRLHRTNSSGYGKVENLSAGQYWVVETSAPQGYAWDGTVYPAAVSAGQCSAVNGGTVTDQPTTDPVDMIISKVDAETGEASQGDGTLAGAVFEVKYYDGWYDESNLPDQATRTWKLKTDVDGFAGYNETYKVEGDAFYYSSEGYVTIPLGTVTIEEVQAPTGYLLPSERSDRYSLQRLTDGTHLQFVTVFNTRTQPEPVIEGAGGGLRDLLRVGRPSVGRPTKTKGPTKTKQRRQRDTPNVFSLHTGYSYRFYF